MSDGPLRPSVLHVIDRAGATNSQYNEHCLPVLHERRITVASLFPADVTPPPRLRMVEGDGTVRGSMRAVRSALALGPYDAVHVHSPASGVLTLAVFLLSLRSRRNLVFTVHNSWRNFKRRNRLFLRIILFLYPTVVVCGVAASESMPRLLGWLVGPRLSVVPNGVDVDRVDLAVGGTTAYARLDQGFTVASVNRLIPLKDPWTVLGAFKRLPESTAELVFVGDGPLLDKVAAGAQDPSMPGRVRFTGIIPRDDVYRLLRTADVFVSASGGEGLPVAVLEAMACGCPVILSDIPPHREIAAVAPGVRLVPVGDVDGFAHALHQIRAYEPAERRELGRRQRRCVAERFSVRSMNEAYRELYMQLMENNGGTRRSRPDDDDVVGLLARMRARLGLCITLTLLGALAGFGYAQSQPPEYQAMTSLIVGNVIGGPADQDEVDATAALAATYADLARREPILTPVAAAGFAETWQELQTRVHAQVGDKNLQLVQIAVVAPTAVEAERLAAAVADQVVQLAHDQERLRQRGFVPSQLIRLEKQITRTQEEIDDVQADLDDATTSDVSEALNEELRRLDKELDEQQTEYAALLQNSSGTADGADVSILEKSYATLHPLRPDRNALVVAGAGVGLTLAAAVAYFLGRRRVARVDGGARRAHERFSSVSEPADADPRTTGDLFDELTWDRGGRS